MEVGNRRNKTLKVNRRFYKGAWMTRNLIGFCVRSELGMFMFIVTRREILDRYNACAQPHVTKEKL